MSDDYPNDADGDALRLHVENGCDMSKPMTIDFQVAVADEAAAKAMAELAWAAGYRVSPYASPDCGGWTCECSTRTLATYEVVIAIQRDLAELSASCNGRPDGWGTFGNAVVKRSTG